MQKRLPNELEKQLKSFFSWARFDSTRQPMSPTPCPNLLQRFWNAFPRLRMTFDTGRTPFLMQAMRRG
ncbi:hypothetical protein C0Z16_03590 [Paraburkholderia rhynchosiae]|uniref:Uncharacterized protein n=2 Tax=Paraburkholderia rhynchosiae TaxID=487049 RepID=A0ABX4VBW7_9BURK|nr:hypothetical protein C0Z16_03590 [Paraburkholderia rhynchosiae]